jgi:large subunit ribosomal protein L18|tara:strand:- start:562 stop:1146 length:585 start_codon:yes stop_codon:yes gene_type:complete
MAKNGRQVLSYKRRRNGKTNYKKRLRLLLSGTARAVIRKTNTKSIIQITQYNATGDKVIIGATSDTIKKAGWPYNGANLPGFYLTGIAAGKKALEKGVDTIIIDVGLRRVTKANCLFAAMKGLKDAGLNVKLEDDQAPSQDRLEGKHISAYAAKLAAENKEQYDKLYSKYTKDGHKPEDMPQKVEEVKQKLLTK